MDALNIFSFAGPNSMNWDIPSKDNCIAKSGHLPSQPKSGMLKMAEKISWKTIEKYFAGIYHREIGKLENVQNFLLENVLRKIGTLDFDPANFGSWKMSETESFKLS